MSTATGSDFNQFAEALNSIEGLPGAELIIGLAAVATGVQSPADYLDGGWTR